MSEDTNLIIIRHLIDGASKIRAIKALRMLHLAENGLSLGLREAKHAIDALDAGHGHISVRVCVSGYAPLVRDYLRLNGLVEMAPAREPIVVLHI